MNLLKRVSLVLLALALAVAMTACGKKDEKDPNKPYAGTNLVVFNCYDYINEDLLDKFTEETGIEVTYTNYTTNEEMYTKLAASPSSYDVIFPSDYMIEQLIKQDMLAELDFSAMENTSGLLEWVKKPSYDPEGKYSVAYMWGTFGLLYNTEMIPEGIDSWGVLFDDTYKGQIYMMDSVRDTLGVGLKYLGYSMNSTSEEELYAARDLLIDQKKRGLVKAYQLDEIKDMMVANDAAIGMVYSGDALYSIEKNDKLAYVVPKEGSNVWVDGMCIPKESKHKEAAQVFIDFLCRPDVAFENQQYIYYSSPIAAVVDMYTEEEKNDPTLNPSDEIVAKCEFFNDISDYNDLYEQVWMEIKQAQ